MTKAICLLVIAVLLFAGLASAQQEFDPAQQDQAVAPLAAVSVSEAPPAAVVVSGGVVSCGTIRLSVQKVLHPRHLSADEDVAVRKYMYNHASDLRKSGNYEATEASIRLLLGIEQAHLPLAWRPKEYMSTAQVVWQMLKYLETYVDVPVQQQQPRLVLPDWPLLGQPPTAPTVNFSAFVPNARDVSCTEQVTQVAKCVNPGPGPCAHGVVGAFQFGKEGGYREHVLAVATVTVCLTCGQEHEPGQTCKPGNPPPKPPGGDIGNNNGQTPGGTPGDMTGVPPGYSGTGNIPPGNWSGPGGPPNVPPPTTPGQPGAGVPDGAPPGYAVP